MSKRIFSLEINEYIALSKSVIVTTRFNNDTYDENQSYREKSENPLGCIYNSSKPVSQFIRPDVDIYVLEMNNEINKIMGIGMIKNDPIYNKYCVYGDKKYNVFSYIGKQRIDRNEMTYEEEQVMKVFDILCFKGKRNLKRLNGIKTFPPDMLYNCKHIIDIIYLIKNAFKKRRLN